MNADGFCVYSLKPFVNTIASFFLIAGMCLHDDSTPGSHFFLLFFDELEIEKRQDGRQQRDTCYTA